MYESIQLRSSLDNNSVVKNQVENIIDEKSDESINFGAVSDFKNVSLTIASIFEIF